MIEVLKPPPFATVQDLGRPGHRHEGVPPAGAMDPASVRWLNRTLGNHDGAAAIEWALGQGTFRLRRPSAVVMGPEGGSLGGVPLPPWTPARCAAGTELIVNPPQATRFSYLAIEGGVDVPIILGSRSTYLPGGFGGLEGRRLQAGDRIRTGGQRAGTVRAPDSPPRHGGEIRVIPGPQAELFDESAWETLLTGSYTIGAASDRMGYRLEGPSLRHAGPASLPSEPACAGAIQVPDGGAPIVLMPDGPTVGGYHKIAVVISADLGQLAQFRPGDRAAFRRVTMDEALRGWSPAP
jgi:biotin-dependent carboxylase-like uncharacterized protein